MGQKEIRSEALARQGQTVKINNRRYHFLGDSSRASFEVGREGLVQPATDDAGNPLMIKAFWEPTEYRFKRCVLLAQQSLALAGVAVADALGGAPIDVIGPLGTHTPFAVVMKKVSGKSWKNLRESAQSNGVGGFPPRNWPPLEVRATWAYGLATALHKMEPRGFVHADLSPGNVMVTPTGNTMGDMALVDFDGFVHPGFQMVDLIVNGSEGYAAPEIYEGKEARPGSDRIGLAILVQEFLLTGAPGVSYDHVFQWAYDQTAEINSRTGEAHPAFKQQWPQLAQLLEATLRSPAIEGRPTPEDWRKLLLPIAEGGRSAPRDFTLTNASPMKTPLSLVFKAQAKRLHLSQTPFHIRATLERDQTGEVTIQVNPGAELRVQEAGKAKWRVYRGGQRFTATAGLVIFDPSGIPAKLSETEP
jgi:serine/threonine protein kinase